LIKKRCTDCNIEKPLDQFHESSSGKYGKASSCVTCRAIAAKKYRAENREVVSKRAHIYNQSEQGKKWRKEYQRRPHVVKKIKRASLTYKDTFPGKRRAAKKVQMAVRNGLLIKPSGCQICKSKEKLIGHHEDYKKIYDVVWMCHICHARHHFGKTKEAKRIREKVTSLLKLKTG
jgi:hypothetical protein